MMTGLLSVPGLAAVWLGMVLAIAMEARIKFKAPSLTREVGLDVGRQVFRAFGLTEVVVLVGLWFVAFLSRPGVPAWGILGLLSLILVLQALWLRPALNARATAIIEGRPVASSRHHAIYMSAEGVKVVALVALTYAHPLAG